MSQRDPRDQHDGRGEMPFRHDNTEQTGFAHHKAVPRSMPPGPGRSYDRRHFERLGIESNVVLIVLGVFVLLYILIGFNIIPDFLGINSAKG